MQPTYLPWMGYFDLIDRVDLFVYYDDVQVVRRSWAVRNRIKSGGQELWLSLDVSHGQDRAETTFQTAEISYAHGWHKKHLRSLEMSYAKAPHRDAVLERLSAIWESQPPTLAALNISMIESLCAGLGIQTPRRASSELEGLSGTKDQRLVSLCQAVGASGYLCAPGSADYINAEQTGGAFVGSGIELNYHAYEHPTYPQGKGPFLPYMGIVDLLCWVGWDQALAVIRSGRRPPIPYDGLPTFAP